MLTKLTNGGELFQKDSIKFRELMYELIKLRYKILNHLNYIYIYDESWIEVKRIIYLKNNFNFVDGLSNKFKDSKFTIPFNLRDINKKDHKRIFLRE